MLRGWIPPLPLALAQLAFGLSWIVLFAVAYNGALGTSMLGLGWVHLIALGWITLAALSILQHVIPGFTGLQWRAARVARGTLLAFAVGVIFLVLGFIAPSMVSLQIGAVVIVVSILIYATLALLTLSSATEDEPIVQTMARAFMTTFLFLVVTVLLGFALAGALAGIFPARFLVHVPSGHAIFGIGGWLTILTVGISARTVQPIMGTRSRLRWMHIASSTSILVGTILGGVGAAAGFSVVAIVGVVLLAIGMLAYALDMLDIIRRASVPHRPPQAFMFCAVVFGVAATVLAVGAAFGENWGPAAVYAALIGWLGSAVLAHVHHIGVRVLLTVIRGEDDETRPWEVLTSAATWTTFGLYESAAVLGIIGILVDQPTVVEVAAVCGFVAFLTMVGNVLRARTNAARNRVINLTISSH